MIHTYSNFDDEIPYITLLYRELPSHLGIHQVHVPSLHFFKRNLDILRHVDLLLLVSSDSSSWWILPRSIDGFVHVQKSSSADMYSLVFIMFDDSTGFGSGLPENFLKMRVWLSTFFSNFDLNNRGSFMHALQVICETCKFSGHIPNARVMW